MRRLVLAALACASAVAVAPAEAATCVGATTVESWSGVCVLGGTWVACFREGTSYPVLVVYVPGPDSGGQPCRPA